MATADDGLWEARDYREFLHGWFEREKALRPSRSIRALARKLAIDPSLLGKILLGERHLATSRIQPVCDLVGLSGSRAEYFRHLVLLAKSKTAREAQALFERLQELRRVAPVPLEDSQESYWDSWLHIALRSLLSCGDFKDEWGRMGSLLVPRQRARRVREAMRVLERLGMISKDQSGFWRPATPFVREHPGTQARALRNYHRQSLLLALDSLEGLPVSRRNISSVSVAVDDEAYGDLVAMIEDLRGRALARSAKTEHPCRVVQLGLQLIPLADADAPETV